MLALSRRGGESVVMHHPAVGLIRVKVMTRDKYGSVRLCIEAPKSVNIMREELLERTVDRKLTREGE